MSKKSGVCSYKLCCKRCKFTNEADRPKSCEAIRCEHYTPCKKCGKNVTTVKGLCRDCTEDIVSENNTDDIDIDIESIAFGNEDSDTGIDISRDVDVSDNGKEDILGNISIGMPGTCPDSYNEECKKYYASQWVQYIGFYRDPTVYSMLHILIILEIELNQIIAMQASVRAEAGIALEKKRESLIKSINDIRKNLPTADAGRLSDGELALSSIYNRYASIVSQNTNGRLRRVLSTEVIALAPVLHYPVDLSELLSHMGYEIADIKKICDFIDQIPKSPYDFAKFMGYPIDKETVADELGEDVEFIIDDEDEAIDYSGVANSG